MRIRGRLASAVVVGVQVFSLALVALAWHGARAYAFSSGDGTSASPYQISTCTELQAVGGSPTAYFELANDIDCTDTATWNGGDGFLPIDGFSGHFDGKYKVIDGLTINQPGFNNMGLFGNISGTGATSVIQNVRLTNVSITGSEYVGGLIGHGSYMTVSNVSVEGSVSGWNYVGGIGGGLYAIILTNSKSSATVAASGTVAGGLIGFSDADAGVVNGYSTGSISASTGAGGLTGSLTTGEIQYAYSTATVTAGDVAGGITGYLGTGDVIDSFAGGSVASTNPSSYSGGVVGGKYDAGAITNSFFDATATGQSLCEGTGSLSCTSVNDDGSDPDHFKETSAAAPLSSWDFTTTWLVRSGEYPELGDLADTPSEPTDLAATNINTTDVSLTWSAPQRNGIGAITDYTVYSRVTGTVIWTMWSHAASTATSATITGLSPNTSYDFEVAAVNAAGTGAYSSVLTVTTDVENITASPDNTADSVSEKVVRVIKQTVNNVIETLQPDAVPTDIVLNDFDEYTDGTGKLFGQLLAGQILHFKILKNGEEEHHTATVKEVGSDYVIFTIASTPFDIRVHVGETKVVNVDGKDVLNVTVNSIKNGTVSATFVQLKVSDAGKVAVRPTAQSGFSKTWLYLVLTAAILLVLAARVKRRRASSRS